MKRDSIVLVGPLPPPIHGASRVTEAVLEQLRPMAEQRNLAVRPVSTAVSPGRTAISYHLSRAIAHIRAAGVVAGACRRGRTVVYLGGAGGSGLWYQFSVIATARALGARVVFHHHAYSYLSGAPSLAMRAIAWATGRSGAHVCLSPSMSEAFRLKYASSSSVLTVSNATFIRPRIGDRLSSRGSFRLVHVSNLTVEKGSLRVVEAFEKLRAADVDVSLTLVGNAAQDVVRTGIREAVARHPGRVHHLGQASPAGVEAALDEADLFVFPTAYRHEAQPMVLLEALARGVPVLSSARGAIGDLLPEEWLIGDAGAVETRIAEMMNADWDHLSAAARDLFEASLRRSDDLLGHLTGKP